jgi:hypothetical protein
MPFLSHFLDYFASLWSYAAMARRGSRKWRRQMASLAVLGVLGIALLFWLFTQIPWDGVSVFVFSLVLVVVLYFAGAELVRRIRLEADKANRFERASHIRSTSQMNHMTPTEFEHFVSALFEKIGYKTTVTKQSGDGGIDVILESRDGKASVQVKRWNGTVGRPEVQKLVGASVKGFEKMYFVTTSDFTTEAREYGAEHGVVLVDGEGLEAMAKQAFGENYQQKTFSFAFQHRMTK